MTDLSAYRERFTAVGEYEAFIGAADGYAARDLCDAALAALAGALGEAEAALASVRVMLEVDEDTKTCTVVMLAANMLARVTELEAVLKESQAELAELKARRCGGCRRYVGCHVLTEAMSTWRATCADFACNRYEGREP